MTRSRAYSQSGRHWGDVSLQIAWENRAFVREPQKHGTKAVSQQKKKRRMIRGSHHQRVETWTLVACRKAPFSPLDRLMEKKQRPESVAKATASAPRRLPSPAPLFPNWNGVSIQDLSSILMAFQSESKAARGIWRLTKRTGQLWHGVNQS